MFTLIIKIENESIEYKFSSKLNLLIALAKIQAGMMTVSYSIVE